jgi:hypothetical protein
MMTSKDGLART